MKNIDLEQRLGISLFINIIAIAVILVLLISGYFSNTIKEHKQQDIYQSISTYSFGYGYGMGMYEPDLDTRNLVEFWQEMYASDEMQSLINQ